MEDRAVGSIFSMRPAINLKRGVARRMMPGIYLGGRAMAFSGSMPAASSRDKASDI